ncbi:DNA polymerase III subunit delta' [Acaryochloris sp. IP29b_bin.148]|uniref:DNA polymerase III subunit delta' n=1 Tax=Acaryochloris sp. IP29b_bin.148 TaxID=2969218 RepID=UPI002603BD26|nr:DNA polymerase III subunit delta' [Acaryochloris sp. IP29b_bin.148]
MFADIVGQSAAIEYLSRAIATQRIAPAYLFAGPEGIGRRLVAEQFLSLLLDPEQIDQRQLQNHPDSLWISPTYKHKNQLITLAQMQVQEIALPRSHPQVRLAQIRAMTQFLSQAPLEASRLAVVIEGAETMGEAAANALLKSLEEPGNATLVLLAPNMDALIPTLVSRCQRIPFRRLTANQVAQVLEQAGYSEILAHPQLLEMAQGSPGRAIAHWQQQQAMDPDLLATTLEALQAPQDCLRLAQTIDQALDLPSQLWLLDYYQQHFWQTYGHSALLHPLEKAKEQLRHYAQPRLVWEVTLLTLAEQSSSGWSENPI